MKRYAFAGSPRLRSRVWQGITAVALLGYVAQPAASHAMRTVPDELRVADAGTSDDRLLSPVEVEQGLPIRIEGAEARRQSRAARRASDAPRDYRIDQPPPDADVPLPADAVGGEIFEERLEGMP